MGLKYPWLTKVSVSRKFRRWVSLPNKFLNTSWPRISFLGHKTYDAQRHIAPHYLANCYLAIFCKLMSCRDARADCVEADFNLVHALSDMAIGARDRRANGKGISDALFCLLFVQVLSE